MTKRIRVLVVDDSAFSRQTIKKMLQSASEIEVVGVATDGMDAMAKTMRLMPDIITLDFEMPEMDGFSFLRWLMGQRPTPVIMVSSHTDKKTVFKALELGALDFISKPTRRASAELEGIEKDLLAKVRGIRNINISALSRNVKLFETKTQKIEAPLTPEFDIRMVAIGTSTGGPPALQLILQEIPADFPAPIIISQHMPRGFTKPLSDRLNKLCGLRVKEAVDGDVMENGTAFICPGGYHMTLKRLNDCVKAELQESAFEDKYVPSVDKMMLSAAKVYDDKTLGVILTGMGNDGLAGMIEIKSRKGRTVAESEKTAVVNGMPGEVVKAGAADNVLPVEKISSEIIRIVMGDRRQR